MTASPRRLAPGAALLALVPSLGPAAPGGPEGTELAPRTWIRGVTISCQTWGREWATPGFDAELLELRELGVNWVAIHPYARIEPDGRVSHRPVDPEHPPDWLANPIARARERGMGILVKPHLAYWGSPFSWRGEIDFESAEDRARFFETYTEWITAVARATRGADAFAVGTELDRLVEHEEAWRRVIASVRAVTDARLTYAANWTDYERVPFWDALDAVGVQAYFPLAEIDRPQRAELLAGWGHVLAGLHAVHLRTGKPVVFTELGYNVSLSAAREPWEHAVERGADRDHALELQRLCYGVGLEVLERERDWLRGAFLWKWFVGDPGRHDADFLVDTPAVRDLLREHWGG